MKTATFICTLRGSNKLYELSDPITYKGEDDNLHHTYYVIVSTSTVFGLETYIFPADRDGNVLSLSELSGSTKGTSRHAEVLRNAGYTVTNPRSHTDPNFFTE